MVLWWSLASRDCVVLRGRTQSISWELWTGFVLEVSSLEIKQGANPFLLVDFGRVWGSILVDSIQSQREPWGDALQFSTGSVEAN